MSAERRRAHRFDREDLALSVYRDGRDMSDAAVVLKDVSRSGVGLQMSGRVDVGDRLSFRMEIPGGAVSGQAAVRWVVEDNIGCRCGLEFQGLGFWDYFRPMAWNCGYGIYPPNGSGAPRGGAPGLVACCAIAELGSLGLRPHGLSSLTSAHPVVWMGATAGPRGAGRSVGG